MCIECLFASSISSITASTPHSVAFSMIVYNTRAVDDVASFVTSWCMSRVLVSLFAISVFQYVMMLMWLEIWWWSVFKFSAYERQAEVSLGLSHGQYVSIWQHLWFCRFMFVQYYMRSLYLLIGSVMLPPEHMWTDDSHWLTLSSFIFPSF